MFFLDILTLEIGPNGYSETLKWNYHFILCKIAEDSRYQYTFSFSVSFCQENAKWWKEMFCDITSENMKYGKIT
jgi:hypothetical protein